MLQNWPFAFCKSSQLRLFIGNGQLLIEVLVKLLPADKNIKDTKGVQQKCLFLKE